MPDSPLHRHPEIAQTAAEWVARRDRGLAPTEQRAFAAWQRADPRHRTELARLERTWHGLADLGTVAELDAMADAVVARARERQARRRRLHRATAILAAAAALVFGWISWQRLAPPAEARRDLASENVRVLDSTLRRMTLPDGSVAELNGNSRIEVDFTPDERRVRLADGEAHFIVAKNPERPFLVTAGPVTVRAVGTAFNVRLASAEIEVLVTEGRVQLESSPAAERLATPAIPPVAADSPAAGPAAALVAGQRAVIERAAPGQGEPAVAIEDIGRAEIDQTLGWQTTRLAFNNTPLEEVVAGFNHYNRHQLTIGDPKLRSRTLTGVFRADNLEGFIRLLKASVDVKAELRTSSETVLLPVR